jgi:hypothetical protein
MFEVSTSEKDAKQGLGNNKIGDVGLYILLEALMVWAEATHLIAQASLFI